MQEVKEIDLAPFVESRSREIQLITSLIKQKKKGGGQNVFQKLPRTMIRRAASEDIRRIPKRSRKFAVHNYKGQKGFVSLTDFYNPKKQIQYQKARRNPTLLRLHYALRQRHNNLWLETHIWHAKRFHMTKLWGYAMALKPTDKYFRSAINNVKNGCTLQDISFYSCIELISSYSNILEKMSHITTSSLNLLNKDSLLTETKIILYHINCFPYKVVGPATIFFVPYKEKYSINDIASLWIISHPGIFDEILEVLFELFNIKMDKKLIAEDKITQALKARLGIMEHSDTSNTLKVASEKIKIENNILAKDCHFALTKCITYSNFKEHEAFQINNTIIKSLKNRMVRMRLLGPLSLRVICEAVKPANAQILAKLAKKQKHTNESNKWWRDFYNGDNYRMEGLKRQTSIWRDLKAISHSPRLLSAFASNTLKRGSDFATLNDLGNLNSPNHRESNDGIIIPLVIRDPRLHRIAVKRNAKYYVYKDRKAAENRKNQASAKDKTAANEFDTNSHPLNSMQTASAIGQNGKAIKRKNLSQYTPNKKFVKQKILPQSTNLPISYNSVSNDKSKNLNNPSKINYVQDLLESLQSIASVSPFWSKEVRDCVTLNKAPDHVLNRMRSKRKVGEYNKISEDILATETYVPILLIYKPAQSLSDSQSKSSSKNRFKSGWDIVIPSNWAMPFWLSLIYAGALPVGLNKDQAFSLESVTQRLHFPSHWPDSACAFALEEARRTELDTKYNKRPANKRVAYRHTANGCHYITEQPFRPAWRSLVKDATRFLIRTYPNHYRTPLELSPLRISYGSITKHPFWVLRDTGLLRQLIDMFTPFFVDPPFTGSSKVSNVSVLPAKKARVTFGLSNPFEFEANHSQAIIKHYIESFMAKFEALNNSRKLHRPSTDFKLGFDPDYLKFMLVPVEIEPVKTGILLPLMPIYVKFDHSKDDVAKENCELALTDSTDNLVQSKIAPRPSNFTADKSGYWCIGFIVNAGYSYLRGQPTAMGFISFAALTAVFEIIFNSHPAIRSEMKHHALNHLIVFITKKLGGDVEAAKLLVIKYYVKSRNSASGYRQVQIKIYPYSF